jgi:glycosyltransferase involved in cell wall biosynthesis
MDNGAPTRNRNGPEIASVPGIAPKILLLSLTRIYGGGESYCVKLARLLLERYRLGTIVANSQLQRQLEELGIRTWSLDKVSNYNRMSRYKAVAQVFHRAIREFQPSVIHLNGQAATYCSLIPKVFGIPAVATRHTAFGTTPAYKRWLVSRSLNLASRVVCVSPAIKRELSAAVPEERLVVISNWVDQVAETFGTRESTQRQEPFRVLYVGRILRSKGCFDLIAALRRLSNVRLDVVGDGADLPRLKAESNGLPVAFHGFQSDCSLFYRQADLLVFPSHPPEGQGQVHIEAMSHGLPCLISNIEVNLDTAANGRAAELFQWGDVDDLAFRIDRLRNRPERLKELQRAGLERVASRYTQASVRTKYFDLFEEVILGRGACVE